MPFTWDPPSDTEFAVGKYFTSSKAKRIRDLVRALAEGASGADRLQTGAYDDESITYAKLASDVFSIGGPGFDGALTSLAAVGATRPVYASSINITAGHTAAAPLMLVYVDGDFTLASGQTLTIPQLDLSGLDSTLLTDSVKKYGIQSGVSTLGLSALHTDLMMPIIGGGHGVDVSGEGGGGGGYGTGTESLGAAEGIGYGTVYTNDLFHRRAFYVGGQGSDETTGLGGGGNAGGSILFLVNGAFNLYGTISAKGAQKTGGGSNEPGGGGGGSVGIICRGAFDGNGGTIDVSGGNGWTNGGGRGGGGGGGYIGVIATGITNHATYTVAGGLDSASGGGVGLAEVNKLGGVDHTYTDKEIIELVSSLGLAA